MAKVAKDNGAALNVTINAMPGLENGIREAGTSAQRSELGSQILNRTGAVASAQHADVLGVVLSNVALKTLVTSSSTEGFTVKPPPGISKALFAGQNNRSLAHEMYHHYGWYNGSFHNGGVSQFLGINLYHNMRLNQRMDSLGIKPEYQIPLP